MRIATLLVVLAVFVTGCSLEELDAFGDVLEPIDLRGSADPVKQGAGYAAETLEEEHAAQEVADEAYREKSRRVLTEQAFERPDDSRYRWYLGALQLADGDLEGFRAWLGASMRVAGVGADEIQGDGPEYRRMLEEALDAFGRVIAMENERDPVDPGRVLRLETFFCQVHTRYAETFGSTARGSLYLAWIGDTSCQR